MAGAFLWDDRVRSAIALTSAAGTPVASLPISNLLDPQPRLRARWLGGTAGVLVDFGTDTPVEAVALISTTLPDTATVRWRVGPAEALVEEPRTVDADFTAVPFVPPTGWLFARAGSAWCFDATGQLVQSGTDVPRFDWDPATRQPRGLLLEESRSNYVRNPRAEGATAGVIGSGGAAPTYWSAGTLAGITVTIVGTGTESGIPYCDIRFSGAATGNIGLDCENWFTAAPGDVWTTSAFIRLVAGSLTNVTGFTTRVYYSGGGTNSQGAVTPTAAALATQRWASAPATAGTGVSAVKGSLRLDFGGAVDLTIRVGAPQMEKGATPSSVILPAPGTPAVTTRASDCAVIRLPSPAALPFTFLVDSGNEASTGTVLPLGLGRTDGVWGFPKATYFVRSPGGTTAGLTTLNDDVGGGSIVGGTVSYPPGTGGRIVLAMDGAGASSAGLDGVLSRQITSVTYPATNDGLYVGGSPWGGPPYGAATGIIHVRHVAFWTKRLSDAQCTALALTGSSLVPALLAHDSGVLAAQTGDAANGNVVLLRSGAAMGRYLQVDVAAPGMDTVDIGRLVAGPLWRVAHGPAYGLQEGREVLDRRDRNALTGAEFPVPALANPRVVRFTLPLLSTAEVRGEHRRMLRALGAAAEALWMPDVGLSLAEMNARSMWGAVAVAGEDAATTRDSPAAWSRSFRIAERP
jgi:hypothetical protein